MPQNRSSYGAAVRPSIRTKTLTMLTVAGMLASIIGFVPGTAGVARAGAVVNTWYVAQTGSASGTDGGGCGTPGFVGTTDVAIQAAVDAAGTGDTIHLCTGTYDIAATVAIAGEALTFEGDDSTSTIVDGGSARKLFTTDSSIAIRSLTLRNGYAASANAASSGLGYGGAVDATGSVTAHDSIFENNVADSNGGAISAREWVDVRDSIFRSNTATGLGGTDANYLTTGRGGAIAACGLATSERCQGGTSATIARTDFIGNSTLAANSSGGAVFSYGRVAVTGGTFLDNTSSSGGAVGAEPAGNACYPNDDDYCSFRGTYADVDNNGIVSVTDATFIANVATKGGGALFTNDGVHSDHGVYRDNDGGDAANGGGAVFIRGRSSTFRDDSFMRNRAGIGGAIYQFNNYPISISGSTFADNTSGAGGGAIRMTGALTLSNSTFYRNRSGSTTPTDEGSAVEGRVVTVRNVTFAENSSDTGLLVPALYASIAGSVANSLFATPWDLCGFGGDPFTDLGGDIAVTDGTTPSGCVSAGTSKEVADAAELDLDPAGLALNAPGKTETIAIGTSSIAKDYGVASICADAATVNGLDQRGVTRPQGTGCDTGAYEFEEVTPPGAYVVGVDTQDCTAFDTIQEAVDFTSGGTIHICGTHDLSTSGPVTIAGKDFVFEGDSSTGTIVDGGNLSKLFVTNQDLEFRDLTLRNGYAAAARNKAANGLGFGGAVEATGGVTVVRSRFIGNTADSNGGAIHAGEWVEITDSIFDSNTATGLGGNDKLGYGTGNGGAILSCRLATSARCQLGVGTRLTRSDFVGNEARIGYPSNDDYPMGGGVFAYGDVDLSGGTFRDNTAGGTNTYYDYGTGAGGAIATASAVSVCYPGCDPATISNGTVSVTDGTFERNVAGNEGGAIDPNGGLRSERSFYRDNSAQYSGGAIATRRDVSSRSDTFTGNTADWGGAFWLNSSPAVINTITDDTFADNTAGSQGGALHSSGTLTVVNSTFFRNRAPVGSAIWYQSTENPDTVATVRNVTLVENSSGTSTPASAVFTSNAPLNLGNALLGTPTDTCEIGYEGIIDDEGGTIAVTDGATPSGCVSAGTSKEVADAAELDLDPAGLALNAPGKTETIAIGTSSIAKDYGVASICADAATVNGLDQRGIERPQGAGCDSGAYEFEEATPPGAYVVGSGDQTCTAFETIQQAVDFTTGGTIHICGTHELTAGITVGYSVAFEGDSSTDTIVDGMGLYRLFSGVTHDLTFRRLTLTHGLASGAASGGGIRAGSVTVESVRMLENSAGQSGGAIYATGSITVRSSRFTGNEAGRDGGAIASGGSVTSSRSTYLGNVARGTSGDEGGGAIYISSAAGRVRSDHDRFERNSANARAGAIHAYDGSVESTAGVYVDNTAGTHGGAIYANRGTLRTRFDSFQGNIAGENGGAAYVKYFDSSGGSYEANVAANPAGNGQGGAVWALYDATSGQDTFRANLATGQGSAIYRAAPGGFQVTNSTFVDNSAGMHAVGGDGALFIPSQVTLYARNLTFVGNRGTRVGAIAGPYGSLTIANTIFASKADGCDVAKFGPVAKTDLGGNIAVTDGTSPCLGGAQPLSKTIASAAGLQLGSLANNGGPTKTVSIGATSVAVDYGISSICLDSPVNGIDQRGVARPQGDGCDAGAFEFRTIPGAYVVGAESDCSAHASIQEAVDVAAADDTIHVCGLHELTAGIVVDQDLTFVGDSSTDTIVDGMGAYRIFASDSDLTAGSMTLRNGGPATGDGGAIYAANVTATGVRFIGNVATGSGGAILAIRSVTVVHSLFARNVARLTGLGGDQPRGGAISAVTVDATGGSIFTENYSDDAGGAIFANVSADLRDTAFIDNTAAGWGGAVGVDDRDGSVDIVRSTFMRNASLNFSGGAIGTNAPVVVVDSHFTENSASTGTGGAIWSQTNSVTVTGGSFTRNHAVHGGAIWADTTAGIMGGSFAHNSADERGGAVGARIVSITEGTFTDNSAGISGGAVFTPPTDPDTDGFVEVWGTSTFRGNHAGWSGGAIAGYGEATSGTFSGDAISVRVEGDATFRENTAGTGPDGGLGGAVYGHGYVAVNVLALDGSGGTRVVFTANRVDGDVDTSAADPISGEMIVAGIGGAIATAIGTDEISLVLAIETAFSGNSAPAGGAIGSASTLVGLSDFTANTARDAEYGHGGATLSAFGLAAANTYSGNVAASDGGAIYAAGSIVYGFDEGPSTFTGNIAAGAGGAIYGQVRLATTTFTDNSAGSTGGAIRIPAVEESETEAIATLAGGDEAAATALLKSVAKRFFWDRRGTGGVSPMETAIIILFGDPSVSDSTFQGNRARGDGGIIRSDLAVYVTNSTFVDNTTGGNGGISVAGDLTLLNGTFLRNVAAGGDGAVASASTLVIANTILGSASDDCSAGTLTDRGGTIAVGTSGCVDSSQTLSRLVPSAAALKLGTLADNGGPTRTISISDGSVAIGYGLGTDDGTDSGNLLCIESASYWSVDGVDQRGVSRLEADQTGSPCDSGAYENTTGTRGARVAVDTTTATRVSSARVTNVDPFYDTATVTGRADDEAGGYIDPTGDVQFYLCYDAVSAANCDWSSEAGTWAPLGDPVTLSGGTSSTDGSATAVSDSVTATDYSGDGFYVFHASFSSGDTTVYLDSEDDGANETVQVAPISVILAYTGPVVVYTSGSGTTASVRLTAQVSPNTHACPVTFDVTGATTGSYGPFTAWTVANGTATTAAVTLPLDEYEVTVRTSGPCTGAPDFTGVLSIHPSSIAAGKGGTGGGWYQSGATPAKVSFGYSVQISATTTKVGRSNVMTTRTKGQLVWIAKAGWRLKASIDFSSTDGSTAWTIRTGCDPTTASGPATNCATFSGSGVLQRYVGGVWVDPAFGRNVSFTVRAYDGGVTSVCKGSGKTKVCSTSELADYFGITMKAGTRTITTSDGVPVNTFGTGAAAGWYVLKQGGIKTY